MLDARQDGDAPLSFARLDASTAPEEMLADGESPLWTTCRAFVECQVRFFVRKQAFALYYDSLDDIVQEVFLSIRPTLERYVAGKREACLTTYLSSIIHNKVVDARRKAITVEKFMQMPPTRQEDEEEPPEAENSDALTMPEEGFETRETLRLIVAHLRLFSRTQPQAQRVETILFEHFLYAEKATVIARQMGLSTSIIYGIIDRARTSLKADAGLAQLRVA